MEAMTVMQTAPMATQAPPSSLQARMRRKKIGIPGVQEEETGVEPKTQTR
jgi:hypothetical protein